MNGSFCEKVVQYFHSIFEGEELHSSFIANCVFNSFLSYTAIMLNVVTIYAMRKTSSLPKTLKTLLLNLAVSDVCVGVLGQPFYTSLLVKLLRRRSPTCDDYKFFLLSTGLFSVASLLGVLVVSFDRFLPVHLHLRYQELVTHKRVILVVISTWMLCLFRSLIQLWVPFRFNSLSLVIVGVVGIILTTIIYSKLYLTVRRHKNQIQSLQQVAIAQTDEMAIVASAMKSALGVFYVYLVFLVCYLPYCTCLAAIKINGPSITLSRFYHFSLTLVFLNSSLNPVIYCWKMRHIRHAIMDILRNMSWNRNRALH